MLFLLLETGLIGVFCALDFFLFYVFWEIVLLPMYFLIGIWGGENRIYAAIKFFIYTLVGSVVMLVVMLVMFFMTEPHVQHAHAREARARLQPGGRRVLFVGLFIGFAIKVPVFRSTRGPRRASGAPTAVSVILAGVLLKWADTVWVLTASDAAARRRTSPSSLHRDPRHDQHRPRRLRMMAQKDSKLAVYPGSATWDTCSGVAAMLHGVTGAVLQMFNHGVSSAMLFLIVGVVYDRAHHRDLTKFGGMGLQMPWYTGIATVGFFASLGLPGLNGFISEFLCFRGAYDFVGKDGSLIMISSPGIASSWIVYVSLLGIILAAVYILWTIQRVYLGNVKREEYKRFPDVSFREVVALAPLAVLCIISASTGILTDFMNGSLGATDLVRGALGSERRTTGSPMPFSTN